MANTNGFVAYANRRLKLIDRQTKALEDGIIYTGEFRDGVRVDTTQETLEEYYPQRAELLGLLEQHGDA